MAKIDLKCPLCGGSGICIHCYGSGIIAPQIPPFNIHNCGSCEGTEKCRCQLSAILDKSGKLIQDEILGIPEALICHRCKITITGEYYKENIPKKVSDGFGNWLTVGFDIFYYCKNCIIIRFSDFLGFILGFFTLFLVSTLISAKKR